MPRQTVLVLALLAATGCGVEPEAVRPTVKVTPPSPSPKAPRNPKIPADVSYRIGSDTDENPKRREVEIKLGGKVSPEILREIALEVKSREDGPHERTVIYYYLPVEFPEIAGQAWASTHFRPDLDVKILGLSQQEEDALRSLPLEHKGKRIGAWLPDNQYKTLDLIYEEDGALKLAEIKSATERTDSPMVELDSKKGRRFRKQKGTNFYDVDWEGNLRISNSQGQVLSAAHPIK